MVIENSYGKCDMNLLSQGCMSTETQTFINTIHINTSYSNTEAKDDNDAFKISRKTM